MACGDGGTSDADETTAVYQLEMVHENFPATQRLGETTLLELGVRNTGKTTVPALTVTITGNGEEGRNSTLPFGFRNPQPGLAQPDRPIWVLSARYPRLAGSSEPAGAETASLKTFDFGPLKPGETIHAVWKLSAVKSGQFAVFYEIGAGSGSKVKLKKVDGSAGGGSFPVWINEAPPETVVTDSGEVVPAPRDPTQANR